MAEGVRFAPIRLFCNIAIGMPTGYVGKLTVTLWLRSSLRAERVRFELTVRFPVRQISSLLL